MRHRLRTCAVAAAVAAGLALWAGVAQAKQCVWNRSGFALKVEWYTPEQISNGAAKLGEEPYQVDEYPLAQGRCSERAGRNVAVLTAEPGDSPFAVSTPTLERWTDVYGTIFSPQFCDGCGGPL